MFFKNLKTISLAEDVVKKCQGHATNMAPQRDLNYMLNKAQLFCLGKFQTKIILLPQLGIARETCYKYIYNHANWKEIGL